MTTKSPGTSELRHGALGTPSVVFFVLAAVAPIGVVASAMALGLFLGNGAGLPGMYVLAGLVLLCFAAGYAAMSKHVTNAGAFYAYIARGLGKPAGLGGAFVAVISYTAVFCSVAGVLGYFAHATAATHLGMDVPWWVWTMLFIGVTAVLGRRQVDLNAAVLGVLFMAEMAIILLLDVKILLARGLDAFSFDSFTPSTVFHGAVGVALVAAFNSFIGFEATAIFGEEARDPERTVPRATYISVSAVAVFYALTCWTLISAYNADELGPALVGPDPASPNPGQFVFSTNQQFVGTFGTNVMEWLVLTSLFAAMLATHNATARYFFAMGREGVLPRALGRTHPTLRSPHIASAVQITIGAVVVAIYALAGKDPLVVLATSMGGIGTIGIVLLQAAAAAAVVGFFWRRPDRRWLTTVVLPGVACVALIITSILVIRNYDVLAGTPSWLLNHAYWLIPIAAATGIGYAIWLRSARPPVYTGIADVPLSKSPGPDQPEVTEPARSPSA